MNQKRKFGVAFFCSLLIALVLEVGTAGADTTFYEWTQNSTFVKSGYQWDQIVYDWQWTIPYIPSGTDCHEVFVNDSLNHVWWLEDGVVKLCATDMCGLDNYGRSARITYGSFLPPYSNSPLPENLSMNDATTLWLNAYIRNYGSINLYNPLSWTGIKFDA